MQAAHRGLEGSDLSDDMTEVTGAPAEFAVPLATFAATLRPRNSDSLTLRGSRGRPGASVFRLVPGEPDEIWLKLLQINHKAERHTMAEWYALIDTYRNQPAHPADPRFGA